MRKREVLLILAVYYILTLFMTYPVVVRLDTHYIGAGSDMWIFPWNDWWLRKCLLEWRDPFYTTSMFYPEGVSLVYHNFAWLNSLAWLLLAPFAGHVVAYNLIFTLNLALGGVGMYALARYLVGNRWAAFLAGLVFAFWPFRMVHFNRPNLISTEWAPLFLLYLIRTVREGRKWRDGLLAGFFLALTGLSRWLHFALAGALGALYVGYSLLFERQRWGGYTFAALALAGLVAVLILAPLGAPLVLTQIQGGEEAGDAYVERPEKGGDLVGYFVPRRGHPVFWHWLEGLWERMAQESFFGYTVLLLALYGTLKARRRAAVWLLLGGLLFIFSLGSVLRVAGRVYQLPMPYRLIQPSFFTGLLREPRRLNIVLGLPVAVLVAYGVKGLLEMLDRRWSGWSSRAVVVLLGGIILFEYLLWPFPTVQPQVSPFYQQLADEPGDFGLLELPMGATTPAKLYMYYATVHGKALVEGHVSRLPGSAYCFIDSVPLTRNLHRSGDIPGSLGDVARQLRALTGADVRYVVLHKDLATAEQVARWREWLVVSPVYEDEQLVVYRTALQYRRDFQFVGEVGDGVGVVGATLATDVVGQGGLLEVEVVWGTRSPPGREWAAYLALVGPAGQEVQRTVFEPCPGWPTLEWGRDAVARGWGGLQLDPFVDGGTYQVVVGLLDPTTGVRVGESLTVGWVEVQAVERLFDAPEVTVESEAVFGAVLRLLEHDLRRGEDELLLTLYWQARRRMAVDYKFFVHLYDAESGVLAAQVDTMPHDWTYPTTWWEAGEVVADMLRLDLSNVVPGRYHLAVGVYDPQTGERLVLRDGGDVVSDAVALEEVVVP
jgi:hypothetical protein